MDWSRKNHFHRSARNARKQQCLFSKFKLMDSDHKNDEHHEKICDVDVDTTNARVTRAMKTPSFFLSSLFLLSLSCPSRPFQAVPNTGPVKGASKTKTKRNSRPEVASSSPSWIASSTDGNEHQNGLHCNSRRDVLDKTRTTLVTLVSALTLTGATTATASAAIGSLPEYAQANAILQAITIRVADKSQQDSMISFLSESFDCQVLRKRIRGNIEETWMGYGPEQLSIPDDFTIPVSSFAKYGGHASIHIVYDSKATTPLYRKGDDAPGSNIAFVQLGVPTYRISKMVANGGNILDAYGIVSVVSPSGLPMRGIIGIWPDPFMFVAINCASVQTSKAYYEQLGFAEQEYPYARPSKGTGQFEPPQPAKSVYMAPSSNCMGLLLLQADKKLARSITPNPVVESLNVVYSPSVGSNQSDDNQFPTMVDPSGVVTTFQAVDTFKSEELITR
jgi:hypothetical protein